MDLSVLESLLNRTAPELAGWLLTYGVHSTLFAGVAWAVARRRAALPLAVRDLLWKTALVGGIATSVVQSAVTGPILMPAFNFNAAPRVEPHAGAATPGGTPHGPAASAVGASHGAPLLRIAEVPARQPIDGPGLTPGMHPFLALESDAVVLPPPSLAARPDAATRTIAAQAPDPADRAELAAATTTTDSPRSDLGWPALFLGVWAAGAFVGLTRLGVAALRLRTVLGERRPVTRGRLYVLAHDVAKRLGYTGPLTLTVSETLPGPVAVGLDEVCLPARVLDSLPEDELRAVLTHEIAHLQRRDPAWTFAARTLEAVFFFQPLNRWMRQQLQEHAEFACDERAAQFGGGGLIVARSLARIAQWVQSARTPLLVSAMARKNSPLVQRVERLLDRTDTAGTPSRWQLAVPALIAGAVLLAAPAVTPHALAEGSGDSNTTTTGKRIVESDAIAAERAAANGADADVIVVRDGTAQGYSLRGTRGLPAPTAYSAAIGTPRKSRIGVFSAPLGELTAEQLGIEPGMGVALSGVIEGSAAEKAGLKKNDVIIALDGKEPISPEEFTTALAEKEPGTTVNLTIIRKGQRQELAVVTEKAPESERFPAEPFFGAPTAPIAAWNFGADPQAQREAEKALAEAMRALAKAQKDADASLNADARAALEEALADARRSIADSQRELEELAAKGFGGTAALAPLARLNGLKLGKGGVYAFAGSNGGDADSELTERWANDAAKLFLSKLEAKNAEYAKQHQEEITAALLAAFDEVTPSSTAVSVSEETVNGQTKREVKGSLAVNRKLLEAALVTELRNIDAAAKDTDRDLLLDIAGEVAGELSKYEATWTEE